MNTPPILRIKDLSVHYKTRFGTTRAVDHVSLDLPTGKVTALVGESGSGKSTLASTLLKVNTGSINGGEVVYNNRDVLKFNKEELRQYRWSEVSMVFQAAQSALNPVMKVKDQFVQTVREHKHLPTSQIMKRAAELLDYVRLDPALVLNSYPHELSGGMKQRVMIAFSLILDPKIVILDEPTTALDVITQDYIFDILLKINRDFNMTMLLVTHDIGIVARVANYIGVMYAGKLVEFGELFRTFESPRHPYTEGLIRSTPSLISNNDEIQHITGTPPDLHNLPSGCPFHPRCPHVRHICKDQLPAPSYFADGEMVMCHMESVSG